MMSPVGGSFGQLMQFAPETRRRMDCRDSASVGCQVKCTGRGSRSRSRNAIRSHGEHSRERKRKSDE